MDGGQAGHIGVGDGADVAEGGNTCGLQLVREKRWMAHRVGDGEGGSVSRNRWAGKRS